MYSSIPATVSPEEDEFIFGRITPIVWLLFNKRAFAHTDKEN